MYKSSTLQNYIIFFKQPNIYLKKNKKKMDIKRIIRESINKILLENINNLNTATAIEIIINSIPNLNDFEPTKHNLKAVKDAKTNNIGFWLFAEYFMKQKDPMKTALSLNYLGNENALASWEIRTPENNDPDVFWITDVQSKQKGGFTEIFNYIMKYCKSNGIQYIGLQAYDNNVKSMYINKFGFDEVDWFLLKEV